MLQLVLVKQVESWESRVGNELIYDRGNHKGAPCFEFPIKLADAKS